MTEKEKMLSGNFYDTRDIELRALSSNAKDLMQIYNSLPAENMNLRDRIIRMLSHPAPRTLFLPPTSSRLPCILPRIPRL